MRLSIYGKRKQYRLKPSEEMNGEWFTAYVKKIINENRYILQKDRLEKELFHSCVLLKNLALVHLQLPLSTDFILEQLMEYGGPLKSIYADVLAAYRRGKDSASFQILSDRVPVRAAQDFARILRKLDYIPPGELVTQMDGFERTFSAERKTKAMARAERKSMFTTLVSTATIFVVLLNFIVVVIFLDTLQILEQLFL